MTDAASRRGSSGGPQGGAPSPRPFDPGLAALPLIRLALAEDLGEAGDVTSQALIPEGVPAAARFEARQAGILAGLPVAGRVFLEIDPAVIFTAILRDGDAVSPGTVFAEVRGPARSLLAGERIALNFLQRLSGVATLTRRFVDAVAGTGVRVADTRKTTPGYRMLEKYAVSAGGGENHRRGLWDKILIKDNHVEAAGGVREALRRVREAKTNGLPVEVEVRRPAEVEAVLELGADEILLDNMSPQEVAGVVKRLEGQASRPLVEVSGGISLATIRDYAIPGVDRISVGSLTHSAPALDLALEFVPFGRSAG